MNIKKFFYSFKYFGRFSFVGAINTGLYFILTNVILFFELTQTIVASNVSYIFLIIISFFAHSNFTFRVKNIEINQFQKFVVLSLAGLILSNLIIILNTQFFSFSAFLVILSITLVIPFINFFVLKYWVFEP